MRRPPSKYPEYRLDALLKRKADQGVKIYVVVYKVLKKTYSLIKSKLFKKKLQEVEMALTLDSRHTKDALQSLSENIVGKGRTKRKNSFFQTILKEKII
jgi:phospholipase D1/2